MIIHRLFYFIITCITPISKGLTGVCDFYHRTDVLLEQQRKCWGRQIQYKIYSVSEVINLIND